MINENKDSKKVLNLIEFTEVYKKNPDLRKCLSYFTDILGASIEPTGREKFEILPGFYTGLRDFVYFQRRTFNYRKELLTDFIETSAKRIKSWRLVYTPMDLYYVRRPVYLTRLDYLKLLWLIPHSRWHDRPKWHYLLAPLPFLGVAINKVQDLRSERSERKLRRLKLEEERLKLEEERRNYFKQ